MLKIQSREIIQAKLEKEKENQDKFAGTIVSEICAQRVRIYEDLLKHYNSKTEAQDYCKRQISLFKTCYGMTVPASQAEFIIDLYHEILGEEKEFGKN